MSSNYSAQQYNDAYLPHRLRNWEIPADRDYEQRPRLYGESHQSSSPYFLVSDRHGRLLPTVKEKLLSRQYAAWDQLSKHWLDECDCILKRKACTHSRCETQLKNNSNLRIPSFFCRRRKKRQQQLRPAAPKKEVDPFLAYLREISLPIIWIMGVPTHSIRHKRKHICREIAEELNFAYVDLDDCIQNWTRRQEGRRLPGTSSEPVAQNSGSFTIPSYRSLKSKKSNPPFHADEIHIQNHDTTTALSNSSFTAQPIEFSTTSPFTTDKVLDLLKFGMVEALPARGFVLDGFPCNLEEASEFERHFYPASLILYFITGTKQEKTGNKKDSLSFPTRFRRRFQFTFQSGETLCSQRNYGCKVIRIMDTENVDKDTLSFLHEVIQDSLEREHVEGGIDVVDLEERPISPDSSVEVFVDIDRMDESQLISQRQDVNPVDRQEQRISLPPLLVGDSSSSKDSVTATEQIKQRALKLMEIEGGSETQQQHDIGAGGGTESKSPPATPIRVKPTLSTSISTSTIFRRNDSILGAEVDYNPTLNSSSSATSVRKTENPDDRPLPLPEADAWWCTSENFDIGIMPRNKSPTVPPPSPCMSNDTNHKPSSVTSLAPTTQQTSASSTWEYLSEWFETGEDAKNKIPCAGDEFSQDNTTIAEGSTCPAKYGDGDQPSADQ